MHLFADAQILELPLGDQLGFRGDGNLVGGGRKFESRNSKNREKTIFPNVSKIVSTTWRSPAPSRDLWGPLGCSVRPTLGTQCSSRGVSLPTTEEGG